MNFHIQDFSVDSGIVIRTSDTESGDTVNNNYNGKTPLDFPARSITTISLSGNLVTEVNDRQQSNPIKYSLSQNFPNPFNPSTTIEYSLSQKSFVCLKVYDILGREVTKLVNGFQNTGIHQVLFNGLGNTQGVQLMSGVYFYTIKADGFIQTKKMVLVK